MSKYFLLALMIFIFCRCEANETSKNETLPEEIGKTIDPTHQIPMTGGLEIGAEKIQSVNYSLIFYLFTFLLLVIILIFLLEHSKNVVHNTSDDVSLTQFLSRL